jgi:6-pyruvoyl-tetrahydropterin synthase related domain
MLAKSKRLSQVMHKSKAIIPNSVLRQVLELFSLIACVCVIAQFIPKNWFNSMPATGGDTGSHFWPVKVLHDYGISHWTARPWNPANNGGEGLLVHYFPLPFLFMALLGYLIPVGMAFNLGTLLPVVTLPLAIWACLRWMRVRFPAPILAAMFSTTVILNEGYTMWGGNTLSTLSGQFAHMYALNFLVLGIGMLWSEIDLKKLPWKSAIFFTAVAISHGYVFFGVPPILFLFLWFHPRRNWRYRLMMVSLSGIFALLLSAWFVGPMILNNPWVTPHSFQWFFQNWSEEVLPRIFDPIIILFVLGLLWSSWRTYTHRDILILRQGLFWFFSGFIYLGFFFLFRYLHLVDVRALPQTQLFWAMTAGIFVALALKGFSKPISFAVCTLIVGLLIPWERAHVIKFPIWAEWNYAGWQSKPKYNELLKLSELLRGDFSQPRVAYEHHLKNNFVGTERVFEMLPMFANRSTTESLYLQSTILAPMIYSLTSEISENGSCPFSDWPCLRFKLSQAADHLDLLGVKELILSSEIALKVANEVSFLKKKATVGPWSVFEMNQPIAMVGTFSTAPQTIPFGDWRTAFWDWYRFYDKKKPYLVTAAATSALPKSENWVPTKECHPSTIVDFSGIALKTDCPGIPHFLKYAYHPSFTASHGEELFLVSPGYIGIVPKANETKLSYGSTLSWTWFRVMSLVTSSAILFLVMFQSSQIFKKYWVPLVNVGLAPSPIPTRKKTLKKKEIPLVKVNNEPDRSLFYLLLILTVGTYSAISYRTASPFFWNWRNLNFNDFDLISTRQGWGTLHKNEGPDGQPIVVKGAIFYSGLATHANSEIKIHLKSDHSFFSGKCGYPDYAQGAEIQCEIKTPSRTLFQTSPLNNSNREYPFKIFLSGEKDLTLIVRTLKDNINAAHAVWVDLAADD